MKTHAGLGPDTLVPRVVSAALKQLQVGAEEGFVLSRVDGNTTVGEICLLVPFDANVTITILKKLRGMGAIDVPGAEPMVAGPAGAAPRKATPAAGTPTTASRLAPTATATAAPRATTPAAGIATAAARSTTPAAGSATTAAPRATTPAAGIAANGPAPTAPSPPSPLVPGLEVTVDQAERIDAYFTSLDDKDAFELLEVTRAADKRAIKRAYFKLSKEFHPDRFFGQNIGPYKERLSRIFQSVKAAFELLSDDVRRAAYEQSTDQK